MLYRNAPFLLASACLCLLYLAYNADDGGGGSDLGGGGRPSPRHGPMQQQQQQVPGENKNMLNNTIF